MGKTGWTLAILDAQGIWWNEARNIEVVTRPLKVSMRLRDEDGAILAQDDRVLLNDRHLRTTPWEPGETALALYTMALAPNSADYNLTVVFYERETLQPVGLRDGSGVEHQLGPLRAEP